MAPTFFLSRQSRFMPPLAPITKDPYKLTLRGEVGDKMAPAIISRITDTVACRQDGDSDLRMFRDQLEAVSNPISNDPWPGAAIIESLLSREYHTTLLSTVFAAAKQPPYVTIEAMDAADIDAAQKYEVWFNLKLKKYGFEEGLYNAIYTALESRFGVTGIAYEQSIVRSFEVKAATSDGVLDPSMVDEDEVSEEQVVMTETPGKVGVKFRHVDPWNFYLFPQTAASPQYEETNGAIAVIERMFLSEEDLLLGIREKGYDREAVMTMIQMGPTPLQGEAGIGREDEFGRDGISLNGPMSASGGMWECFQVIGRAPYLSDSEGHPTIPDALLHTDCLWMVCPQANVVFKQSYSPYPKGLRPYTVWHAYDKPDRLEGEGIVSLLTPIHDEHTATQRFYINNMNLEACPAMTVPETYLTKYGKWKMAPGRFLPRLPGDDVGPKPLVWDIGSQQLIMPMMDRLEAQAGRLAAAEGVNVGLNSQPFKAEQVKFADMMQQLKFDLILANIQRGIKETARIVKEFLVQHMDDQEDVLANGEMVSVTREMAEKEFDFIPQANSQSASPLQRQQQMQNIAVTVQQWWQWKMTLPPEEHNAAWRLARRLLMVAGERTPEEYLGPEPPSAQEIMAAQQMMAEQAMMGGVDPMTGMPMDPGMQMGMPPPMPPQGPPMNGLGGGGEYDLSALGAIGGQ